MKLSNYRHTLGLAALAFLMAGCLGASPTAGQPAVALQEQPATALPFPTTVPPTATLMPVEFAESLFEFSGGIPAAPVIEHAPIGAWMGRISTLEP